VCLLGEIGQGQRGIQRDCDQKTAKQHRRRLRSV
jgi:hypothetical protein